MDAHDRARPDTAAAPPVPESAPESAPDAAVVEFVTALPVGRALDLGCGAGRHAVWLAVRAWQVTAVDLSAAELTRAVRAAEPLPRASRERLTWVHADVTDLDYRPGYDLVLACHLGLSPESRRRLLRRAATALRPGGTLLALERRAGPDGTSERGTFCTPTELADDLRTELTVTAARWIPDDTRGNAGTATATDPAGQALVVAFRGPVGT